MRVEIRKEKPQDVETVYEVNLQAFGQRQEARIVDMVRENCDDLLSLVAIVRNRIVGHILFSPATIQGDHGTVHGMGLAPMAVVPRYQRQGIGTELIRAGLEKLQERHCPFVIVLGHPRYYPRFGFEPADRRGIHCEWDVPEEACMILILDESACTGISGVARYRPEFAQAG